MPTLSDAQVGVLRKVVRDSAFRQAFTADPGASSKELGIQLSQDEMQSLKKVTPEAVNQLTTGIQSANIAADGTHTLLYAVAIAVLIE